MSIGGAGMDDLHRAIARQLQLVRNARLIEDHEAEIVHSERLDELLDLVRSDTPRQIHRAQSASSL